MITIDFRWGKYSIQRSVKFNVSDSNPYWAKVLKRCNFIDDELIVISGMDSMLLFHCEDETDSSAQVLRTVLGHVKK